jgi:hypothetical protein
VPERIAEHHGNLSWDLNWLVVLGALELAQVLSIGPSIMTIDADGLRNSTCIGPIVKGFDFVLKIIISENSKKESELFDRDNVIS